MNSKPLQKYVGRDGKAVLAGRIEFMAKDEAKHTLMIHAAPGLIPFPVNISYLQKCRPQLGGYFVEDENGTLNYLDFIEFKAKYTLIDDSAQLSTPDIDPCATDFSAALMWMKNGQRIMRRGWNGKGQFVWLASVGTMLQDYDSSPSSELEWSSTLMLRNAQNKLTTWVPSIGDILAEDWDLYEERQAPTISDHQHQALEELEQITEKLASLTAFINDPGSTFSMLSTDEQHQLRMKASYQEDYARALKRIADGLGGEGGAV